MTTVQKVTDYLEALGMSYTNIEIVSPTLVKIGILQDGFLFQLAILDNGFMSDGSSISGKVENMYFSNPENPEAYVKIVKSLDYRQEDVVYLSTTNLKEKVQETETNGWVIEQMKVLGFDSNKKAMALATKLQKRLNSFKQ